MRHAVAGEPHHSCSCLKSTPYTKHRSSRDGVLMGMPARRPDIHSLAWSPHGGAENTGPILWANQINILYSLSFYISIYTHTHLKETLKDIYIYFFFVSRPQLVNMKFSAHGQCFQSFCSLRLSLLLSVSAS